MDLGVCSNLDSVWICFYIHAFVSSSRFDIWNQNNKKESKMIKLSHDGVEYEVEIMDPTHLKFRTTLIENSSWCILHIAQLSEWMIDQLFEKKVIMGGFFLYD